MLVGMLFFLIGMMEGEELKAPRLASAAATRDDRLPHSRQLLIIKYFLTKIAIF